MPYFKFVRMTTNHLAMKQFLFKITELEIIWLCAWRQEESLASIVDSMFEQSLVNDSSANTPYLSEEAYEERLAVLWKMSNFSSSMHMLLKKVT